MPKVSVIVPNYNHSKYLEKRIDSILGQSYQDFELLVLDDCSTDNSQEIIASYTQLDPRVKHHFNVKNSGSPFQQWHSGLRQTSGEFVWIAESDDFADSLFLETLVDILETYPNVGLAYTQSWAVDERDTIMYSYLQWTDEVDPDRWKTDFINSGVDEAKRYFCLKNTIPNASAVVFRRSCVSTENFLEKTMRLSGDKVFWGRILMNSDIAFVASHQNFFRHHLNNARTKTDELEAIVDNFRWVRWLGSNVNIPSENWRKIKARVYVWAAGYIIHNPKRLFTLCQKHTKMYFDDFFYAKLSYVVLKEIVYRIIIARIRRPARA
ncbi:MAG: glycosyltransferase family 2 protein [Phormidesmis sp.]